MAGEVTQILGRVATMPSRIFGREKVRPLTRRTPCALSGMVDFCTMLCVCFDDKGTGAFMGKWDRRMVTSKFSKIM